MKKLITLILLIGIALTGFSQTMVEKYLTEKAAYTQIASETGFVFEVQQSFNKFKKEPKYTNRIAVNGASAEAKVLLYEIINDEEMN